jgi:hypothetical protein
MHISKAGADVRTSNWEDWPLSEEQVRYASGDVALGLLAFMFKFDMFLTSSPELSKAAIDALVDLVSVDAKSLGPGADMQKGSAKVMKKPAASDAVPGDGDENKGQTHANFFQHMRNSNVKAPNIGKKDHPKGSKDALANVCVVVTGTLDSFERSDMEDYVKEHGGKVSKTVTSKVTHLVTDHGEAGPSKLAKCKELGIPVVSEDVILQMVGGGDWVPVVTAATAAEAGGDSSTPNASKKRTGPIKKDDEMAVEASSSVGAEGNLKKRGRPTKKCNTADETTTTTSEGKDAKPADQGKAIAGAAVPMAKKLAKSIAKKVRTSRDSKKVLSTERSDATADDVALKETAEIALGTRVRLQGIHQKPELNGCEGKCVKRAQDGVRWAIQLDDGGIFNLMAEKLEALLEVADRAGTASSIATPARKRKCSKTAQDLAELKEKDAIERVTKKSQAAKGAIKRVPKEMAQAAPAVSTEECLLKASVDVDTPGAKNRKDIEADAETGPTPPKKARKTGQAKALEAGSMEVDGETLSKAKGLSMDSQLMNLANRPELQAKGFSAASLLAALEKTNGLVNPAKHLLLGN